MLLTSRYLTAASGPLCRRICVTSVSDFRHGDLLLQGMNIGHQHLHLGRFQIAAERRHFVLETVRDRGGNEPIPEAFVMQARSVVPPCFRPMARGAVGDKQVMALRDETRCDETLCAEALGGCCAASMPALVVFLAVRRGAAAGTPWTWRCGTTSCLPLSAAPGECDRPLPSLSRSVSDTTAPEPNRRFPSPIAGILPRVE